MWPFVWVTTGENMPVITLPDGSERSFDNPVTVSGVAADIGPGLAKATIAGRVDDELVDAGYLIEQNAQLVYVVQMFPFNAWQRAVLHVLLHDAASLRHI